MPRIPWEDYLSPTERQEVEREDQIIRWMLDRIVLAKARRQKVINRAISRARLEEKRNGRQPRAYRKAA